MAMIFGKNNRSVAFDPTSAFPLDARSYFESYLAAESAAKTAEAAGSTNTQYYYGQTLVVVDSETVTANLYIIQPDKTLKQFGETKAISDLATTVANLASNVYTKEQSDKAIAAAVAAAPHMKRVIVEDKNDIDVNVENAEQYIYMVPSGLQHEDNKYYEYIVAERIVLDKETKEPVIDETTGEAKKEKYLEKIGSWEVNLSDYVTKNDFNTTITEINGKLDKKLEVVNEGDRLISANEAKKLSDLALIKGVDNKTLTLDINSGTLSVNLISSAQVSDLEKTLSDKAGDWKGLSENNYTNEEKTKLSNLVDIHDIDTNQLKIENNILSIKTIGLSQVTDLVNQLAAKADAQTVNKAIGDLNTGLIDLGNKVNDIDARLIWGWLTEEETIN